jgi:molybdopterin/thiamine biosynthesis adenylyltransferase
VIGVGGIGSVLIEQLARTGVQELVLIDPDDVERSNLNRLAGAYHTDVGLSKVDVAKRHVAKIDPSISVETVQGRVQDSGSVLATCDVLLDGLDRMSARMWTNEFAVKHLLPLFDAGSLIRLSDNGDSVEGFEGYIQTVVPGATGCFDCLDRSDPEQARIESLPEEELEAEVEEGYVDQGALTPEPAVMPLNGIVASKAVEMVIKYLVSFDHPAGFVRYDGVANEFDAVETHPVSNCITCGEDGMLGRGTSKGHAHIPDDGLGGDELAELDDTDFVEPASIADGSGGVAEAASHSTATDDAVPEDTTEETKSVADGHRQDSQLGWVWNRLGTVVPRWWS